MALRYPPLRAAASKRTQEKIAQKQTVGNSDNSVARSFRKGAINLNAQKEIEP
jgi:hypothetical protein